MHSKSTRDGKINGVAGQNKVQWGSNSKKTTALPAKLPRIVVYIPEEVKADLERLAKSHYRPVSNMVLTLIQEAIDRAKSEGRIPQDDRPSRNSDRDKKEKIDNKD